MIVEEKKADEKLCCGPNPPAKVHCIGSRCMAWRWANASNEAADELPSEWRSTTHGFCGLAGKP